MPKSTEPSIIAIHLRPAEGERTQSAKQVRVLPEIGLEGDYQSLSEDAATKNCRARAVTLIEQEAVDAVRTEHGLKLTAAETCRNLITQSADLNAMVGKRFMIGDPNSPDHVVLSGTGLCHPCTSLEARTRPGIKAALKGRGGLCAEIVKPGVVRVGDRVTVVK